MKKRASPAQPRKAPTPAPGRKNPRLAAQRRKVLGAHYAAKYRVGKR